MKIYYTLILIEPKPDKNADIKRILLKVANKVDNIPERLEIAMADATDTVITSFQAALDHHNNNNVTISPRSNNRTNIIGTKENTLDNSNSNSNSNSTESNINGISNSNSNSKNKPNKSLLTSDETPSAVGYPSIHDVGSPTSLSSMLLHKHQPIGQIV